MGVRYMCAQKHFASLSNQRMCCPFSGPTLWLAQHQPFHKSKPGRRKKMSSENLVRQREYVIRLLCCRYKFMVVMKINIFKITAKCNLQRKQTCSHWIRNWTVTLRDFPAICCAIEGRKTYLKNRTNSFILWITKCVISDWSYILLLSRFMMNHSCDIQYNSNLMVWRSKVLYKRRHGYNGCHFDLDYMKRLIIVSFF